MILKPAKVPQKEIVSIDVPKLSGGLFLNGAKMGPKDSFINGQDVELDINGYAMPRRKLLPFLPDTVESGHQKFPVFWEDEIYYFTADDGKIKYCQEGDTTWTDCDGVDNDFITNAGGMCKFDRVLNNVFIINGKNGDKLAYAELETSGFPIVKYTPIADPSGAPTKTLTGLSAGSYSIYYAYSYTTRVGETMISPILTVSINHTRDEWSTLPTTPGSITITRPGSAPAGALNWNCYISLASTGGTIVDSDMLRIGVGLDLNNASFIDNGLLAIDLTGYAPTANNTDGPRVDQIIVEDGNPILFGDIDNPYSIWIGGGGPYAMDFSVAGGGDRVEPEKGTNYYPTTIIGFRTGQGLPALTVLYSNTQGLSKQAVLQQQTVNYGDSSATFWGVTEQHYGAAGVAAGNSAINYNGKLLYWSTDGVMSMETQASIQNVLSVRPISLPVDELIRTVKNSAMSTIVGAAWNNKYMWLVPSNGFDTPQQILVLDTNNKGVEGNGAWEVLDIPAQWIGVVSPQNSAAFVYICQGTKSYKLLEGVGTFDLVDGIPTPFATAMTGPMLPISGEAHNTWMAEVQIMFDVLGILGEITVGVNYKDLDGTAQTEMVTYPGPAFAPSHSGGWGDPEYTFGGCDQIPGYGSSPTISSSASSATAEDQRIPVRIDNIGNGFQWFLNTPIGYNDYKLRAISLEGINLGVRPDLQ